MRKSHKTLERQEENSLEVHASLKDVYQKVVYAAEQALEALTIKKNGEYKSITGKDLHNWVKENKGIFPFNVEELDYSWGAYLTRAVTDPDTRISREPGKYNYILSDKKIVAQLNEESELEKDSISEVEESGRNSLRELKLYELLSDWFKSQKYSSAVTADRKKGKVWGNPDVTGILVVENLIGNHTIEIATIEAKISFKSWRKDFFEAVSHKRFSNRAYFAFAHPAENASVSSLEAIPEYLEMRKYAEKYKVGLLVVFVKPEQYQTLIKADLNRAELELSLDDVVVMELWPAVFDVVANSEINHYLTEVLELKNQTSIFQFGFK